MIRRISTTLLAVIVCGFAALAQVSFSVNAPGRVSVGDKFHVTYVLKNARASKTALKAPQINGCTLIYGPTTMESQSYQNINGKSSSSFATEFTYSYRADKEGTYTISAASITAEGKRYTTKPTSITIVAASNKQAPPSSRQTTIDDIETQTSDRPVGANDVFIRIATSRSSTYEQEAIECTIKLYTKYSIDQFMTITQPTFSGFLVDDLPIQTPMNSREVYNGQEYMTAVIKKCILFPQKAGKLTIVSGSYDLDVVQYDMINAGFYSIPEARSRKIRVNSNSASVNVLPLPTPKPAGFTGAVGQFTVDMKMSTNSFRTNEPATLTYLVNGSGNIKYLADPEIDFPSEFELYTPQHNVDAKVAGDNVRGYSRTELTFVPKDVGTYKVRVPAFVYFNPQSKEYVTIPGKEFDVKVLKGVSSGGGEKQDVSAKNTDILFIKTGDLGLTKGHTFIISESWYWMAYLILLAAFIVVLIMAARTGRRAADVTGMRMSKANKVARRRLQLAHKFMTAHDPEKFYEETLRALWGYMSDKLAIPVADLSRDTIARQLSERGVSDEMCNSIIALLDKCEMARYTPSGSDSQIKAVYDEATTAINNLEKSRLQKTAQRR